MVKAEFILGQLRRSSHLTRRSIWTIMMVSITLIPIIGLLIAYMAMQNQNFNEALETKPEPKDDWLKTVRITKDFLMGGDVSALAKIEEMGGVFREAGNPGDPIEIMVRHGFSCFRLRLFVNPPYTDVVVNDLLYMIALAKRIRAIDAKAEILLDFHYSNTWSDPGQQTKPEAWKDLDFDALVETVYNYTRDCIAAMKREGILPDMVQIGNEVNNGILWPDGKLYGVGDLEEQRGKFARLLKAGVQGVKDATEGNDVKIILHIAHGGSWENTLYFFENIEKQGVPYDIIGLSYYPWWHGTIDDLRENLNNTSIRFGKDVFIVETAYPYRFLDVEKIEYANSTYMNWPMTPEGQKSFLIDVVRAILETPNNHGLGVLWWYPESIPVKGFQIWNGGATALFNQEGDVLPAMDVFKLLHKEQNG